MGKKRVLISYGVDVDAVAGWLGSYGGQDSTNDISRGWPLGGFHGRVTTDTYQASLQGRWAWSGC